MSQIRWSIRSTRAWDAKTNELAASAGRQSDLYVLCLLKHQDKATFDPLNLDQWEFFVVPTALLDERLPGQKAISLKGLEALGTPGVLFSDLRRAVEAAQGATTPPDSPRL